MKLSSGDKKLIKKLNTTPNCELTDKEILMTFAKYYKFGENKTKTESLELFKYLYFSKKFKNKEVLNYLFNKYCKVETWFKIEYLEDGSEMLAKDKPFKGYDIVIEKPKQFKEELKSFAKKKEFEITL